MKSKIRQPIVTVVGHVDHGKTSLLDRLRESSVHKGEAGGITQKISFTSYPAEQLKASCPLLEKQGINLDIPGFLFIDTPGHAAFTNLRKRGGSLADLAILVIDINEGIKPQTSEVIQILKRNKVAFIIALNKIDKIHGWKTNTSLDSSLKKRIEMQPKNTSENFNEKYMTLMGALQSHGFDCDLFYNIEDFTKKIAFVPCSAKTGEGIPELILMLCGLSQKYLHEKLVLGKDAKGIMLEVKKQEKGGEYIEAILYDGELERKDEIAVAGFSGKPIITKIRVLEEIQPLSFKFLPKDKVQASTGIRLQLIEKEDILPGMPFQIYKNNKKEIEALFAQQISESIKTSKNGIIAKADSLGSLEALLTILSQENVPVLKAGIGSINKSDVVNAKANLQINEIDAMIVGFNVSLDSEAEAIKGNITILTDEVIYKLVENLHKERENKRKEIEKRRLLGLSSLCKLRILKQHVFRNTSPAIFGVCVEAGKLISGLHMIDEKGEKIGRVKNIQSENKSVEEASEGKELAISMPGINFERVLGERNFLYSDMAESQFRSFKKNKDLLSSNEISLLQEIAEIKRKSKADWGM